MNFNFRTALTSIFPGSYYNSSIVSGKSFTSIPYQIIIAIGSVAIFARVYRPYAAPAFFNGLSPFGSSTLASIGGTVYGLPNISLIFIPNFGAYSIGGSGGSGCLPNSLFKSIPNLGFSSSTTG